MSRLFKRILREAQAAPASFVNPVITSTLKKQGQVVLAVDQYSKVYSIAVTKGSKIVYYNLKNTVPVKSIPGIKQTSDKMLYETSQENVKDLLDDSTAMTNQGEWNKYAQERGLKINAGNPDQQQKSNQIADITSDVFGAGAQGEYMGGFKT